jgi:hypothetical protein
MSTSKGVKLQKKPVIVDGILYDGSNLDKVFVFMGWENSIYTEDHRLIIQTLEGDMHAAIGDWIIKGVNGEFYPCKPDIVAKTYEILG